MPTRPSMTSLFFLRTVVSNTNTWYGPRRARNQTNQEAYRIRFAALDGSTRSITILHSSPGSFPSFHFCRPRSGARNSAGHIRALAIRLASRHGHVGPRPARARPAAARNDNIISATRDRPRTRNVLEGEVGDGHAAGGRAAVEVAAVVVLLNQDAIPRVITNVDAAVSSTAPSRKGRKKRTSMLRTWKWTAV